MRKGTLIVMSVFSTLCVTNGAYAQGHLDATIERFTYSQRQKVKAALDKVNAAFKEARFKSQVVNTRRWDYTRNSGSTVHRDVCQRRAKVIIRGYGRRFSRAIAYTSFGSGRMNLNTYKLNRSVNSIASTIAHEWSHLSPETGGRRGYGHGSNSSAGKRDSVPYKLGRMVSNYQLTGVPASGTSPAPTPPPSTTRPSPPSTPAKPTTRRRWYSWLGALWRRIF